MATTRAISVVGGSVQLRLQISGSMYLTDVWSANGAWVWTAKVEKSRRHLGDGQCDKWSEARTAAFRACVRHSKEKH